MMEAKFIKVIKEYINLIDNCESMNISEFLFQCSVLLPQILFLGRLLPFPDWRGEEEEDEETEEERKAHEESIKTHHARWRQIFENLTEYLGKYNIYNTIFSPYNEKESMNGHLADDLSDIYLDVLEPLEYYEEDRNKAVFHWKINIFFHCGHHIVSALPPIHQYIEDHDEDFGW